MTIERASSSPAILSLAPDTVSRPNTIVTRRASAPPRHHRTSGAPDRENDLPPIQNVQSLYSLAQLAEFKTLPTEEKLRQSIAFTSDRNAQYQYYLDRHDSGVRLNIVGHGDRGGVTFKADLPGGNTHAPDGFAELIRPLIARTDAAAVRLVSCRSAATGFAERLADRLQMPVTAPMGTVTAFEVTTGRYWILEKSVNPRSPSNHEWKTFRPSPAATQAL